MARNLGGRTVRELQSDVNVWGVVDAWAAENGYALVAGDQVTRVYKRGTGFWTAPQMFQIGWTGNAYRLEAWVSVTGLNRVVTLGLMPEEMMIDGGGFVGSLPRQTARKHVNALLPRLGLAPID